MEKHVFFYKELSGFQVLSFPIERSLAGKTLEHHINHI